MPTKSVKRMTKKERMEPGGGEAKRVEETSTQTKKKMEPGCEEAVRVEETSTITKKMIREQMKLDPYVKEAMRFEKLCRTFKNPTLSESPRFQLFSIEPHLNDSKFKKGKLFGTIAISDKYGLLPDVGMSIAHPQSHFVPLFSHDSYNPVDIINDSVLSLGNPGSPFSIPFFSFSEIEMLIELYVTTEKYDALFQLSSGWLHLPFKEFWDYKFKSRCMTETVRGDDGYIDMHYILLRNAVDTAMEIMFNVGDGGLRVSGKIYAYYGNDFPYFCPEGCEERFMAVLFRPDPGSVLKTGNIQLMRSVLAVPTNGSLVIAAHLTDCDSEEVILNDIWEIKAKTEGFSNGCIQGKGCSFGVKVEWKY